MFWHRERMNFECRQMTSLGSCISCVLSASSQDMTLHMTPLVSAGNHKDQTQYPLPESILLLFFVIICLVIGTLMFTDGLSSDIPRELDVE